MESPVDTICSTTHRKLSASDGAVSIDIGRLDCAPTSPRKSIRCDFGDAHFLLCTTWISNTIAATVKSLTPRRLDEPTGPFELVSNATDSA